MTQYGLVEVAHQTVNLGFEPFVVAQQATQVYYIPYPCKSVRTLTDWWVVYKVNAPSKLLVPSDQDYDVEHTAHGTEFFQEDGLEGTFVINIFEGLQRVVIIKKGKLRRLKTLMTYEC
jgi:hypothetical protein